MSKELDELTRVENNIIYLLSDCSDYDELVECFKSVEEHKSCEIIRKALQRLESIDNANPSEALKDLKELHELAYGNEKTSWKIDDIRMSSHIKQALLKAQEQEKENAELKRVLKIVFEKKVDIEYLSKCNDIKEYNAHWCDERFYLTQKEFNLLKSWLDNKKEE